jgi:hypothetical protein
VRGVATQAIITDVVKNGNISSLTIRDRFNKPSIHEAMDSIKLFINSNLTISSTCDPVPIPAASFFIDGNFPKDTTDRFGIRIVDDKNIRDVHNTSITDKQRRFKAEKFAPVPGWTEDKINEVRKNN